MTLEKCTPLLLEVLRRSGVWGKRKGWSAPLSPEPPPPPRSWRETGHSLLGHKFTQGMQKEGQMREGRERAREREADREREKEGGRGSESLSDRDRDRQTRREATGNWKREAEGKR